MATQLVPAEQMFNAARQGQEVEPDTLATRARNAWRKTPLRQRLRIVRRFRQLVASEAEALAELVTLPQRSTLAETIAAEVAPLLDACRFLEREACRILKPRAYSSWRRWLGLGGVSLEVRREPLGVVLILGPSNYPLFLAGVQCLQALVAGNGVELKPGDGGCAVLRRFVEQLETAGLPRHVVHLWDDTPEAGAAALAHGADKVFLTGSAQTGRHVLRHLADSLTPAVMELSGCDPLLVLADADLERAAQAVAFGLRLNGGATCIAPRRILVHAEVAGKFESMLPQRVEGLPPVSAPAALIQRGRQLCDELCNQGAKVLAGGQTGIGADRFRPTLIKHTSTHDADDLFLPLAILQTVTSNAEAVSIANQGPYALGASVFGKPEHATQVAAQLNVATVTINDLIAPTADPRLPFAARAQSGFGVTRGAEGLLEMTQLKVLAVRHGRWLPHLEEPAPSDAALLAAWLRFNNAASWSARWRAAGEFRAALSKRGAK